MKQLAIISLDQQVSQILCETLQRVFGSLVAVSSQEWEEDKDIAPEVFILISGQHGIYCWESVMEGG